MSGPVFFDPKQRRWKRLRRAFDALGLALTLLVVYFVVMVLRNTKLQPLLLPAQTHSYHALKEKEKRHPKPRLNARKSHIPPTQVRLNSDEGIRAAFYVTWDPASFSSLREYLRQIDLLFPEWLHVFSQDGRLQAINDDGTRFDVIKNGAPLPVDERVMALLRSEEAEMDVLPLVNNFDGQQWVDISPMLSDPAARARLRHELLLFAASDRYRGITLDLESFPVEAQPGYRILLEELQQDLHGRGLKLYVAVPARNNDFDYRDVAAHSDGVILMNYDEHYPGSTPGPVVSQDWFTDNVQLALDDIPPDKLLVAIANYGYEWQLREQNKGRRRQLIPVTSKTVTVQEAWLKAHDSEAPIEFGDALNPHIAFSEDNGLRHEVWFADAVSAVNQMRAAQKFGINTFALWRLGSEDRSLWAIWDNPQEPDVTEKLRVVPPGHDVALEGQGDIAAITARPSNGERVATVDPESGLIEEQEFTSLPIPYELTEYGGRTKQVALSFDDGPDPKWTPKFLDVLREKNVKALFFLIGMQAEKYSSITQRIFQEGHEIGNHTWTHPDISNIHSRYLRFELNLTERYFAARLGIKPLMFRPPYSIDQEPDTADQVRPLQIAQDMGYITIGDKIDPNDWRDNPRRSAQELADSILHDRLPPCAPNDQKCGSVILLHDGGGDRSETLRALPMIIDGLRARGFEIIPVSQLMGKRTSDVMPSISANERWSARFNLLGFWLYGFVLGAIVVIFFVGDALMSARLLVVGVAATFDRLRPSKYPALAEPYLPTVAVLIPAYNEEAVIERTVRSALLSKYPQVRAIVIDDGSTDHTCQVVEEKFRQEIADGRVRLITEPNGGKAQALNCGLEELSEELFVGIDADTIIHPDAIALLVTHFQNPAVAAVAGNAKVGNRVNLWTRWQALEYITSQNFERRALNCLGAVSVVPGAIGAWRTETVRAAGGYQHETVAEDADLTMELLRRGYRIEYEDRALAFTEAPATASALMRQRFRWSFGILQSVWKHRHVVGRRGVLGWVALPNIVIFQILLPLVSPFIDLMFLAGVLNYSIDHYFHPETANPASLEKLVAFFLAFMVIDFIASALAFTLERRTADRRESVWLLGHVWLQRFAYRQLFSWVIFKTLKRAFDGRPFSWDKLERAGTVEFDQVQTGIGTRS